MISAPIFHTPRSNLQRRPSKNRLRSGNDPIPLAASFSFSGKSISSPPCAERPPGGRVRDDYNKEIAANLLKVRGDVYC